MEIEQDFQRLKSKILEVAEPRIDLEQLKNNFKQQIDSTRALSRIQNLADLLYLLEMRSCLDCYNIFIFEYLANILQNSKIWNLIKVYRKLHLDDGYPTCVCGLTFSLETYQNNTQELTTSAAVINPVLSTPQVHENVDNNNNSNDDLDKAIEILAFRLKDKWRVLASELEVIEYHIDEVRINYPHDFVQQARRMLQIWRESNRETASIAALDRALESRLCKRKGLGSHLRQPIIGLTN